MKKWRETLVSKEDSLRSVLLTIDKNELQVALVADESLKLLGLITDGDVRRALLRGLTLEATAADVMTSKPTVVKPSMKPSTVDALMRQRELRHIPIVDEAGRILDLALPGKSAEPEQFDNEVVLMAGGLGTRLGELTKELPKPLLRVGGKPILETILESFLAQGFSNFTIAVNYRSELIEDYFGDGNRWGVRIDYLREEERLGTCGALRLFKSVPQKPFFVMNADLLTQINFVHMLEFHLRYPQVATMAVREYQNRIPFGVVKMDGSYITDIVEKPVQQHFVNAGVYILDPSTLQLLPKEGPHNMTTLFHDLIERGEKTASFAIHEYWLDIGRLSDFERANLDYSQLRNPKSSVEPDGAENDAETSAENQLLEKDLT